MVDGFGGFFSRGFGATASRTLFMTLSRLENSSPPGLGCPENKNQIREKRNPEKWE